MTPLQLNALSGLMQNQGLQTNAAMLTNINTFESQNGIANLLVTIQIGATSANANANSNITILTSNTLGNLKTIGWNVCAALSDSFPANARGYVVVGNNPAGLTGQIKSTATAILPSDYTKFVQAFSAAQGYVVVNNQIILTNKNSQRYLGPVFSNMGNLTTGGISAMTTNLQLFALDLRALGQLWNFEYLNSFGSPAELLRQLQLLGGFPPALSTALTAAQIPEVDIANLSVTAYEMSDTLQAAAYKAMQKITGNDLQIVLSILGVTTANLSSMADLLNPIKLFPNSFNTLTTPIGKQTPKIYLPDRAVNSALVGQLPAVLIKSTSAGMPYERLLTIIPSDQALAFKALQQGFIQIKNISEVTLPALASTTAILETPSAFPLINNLTVPVPVNVFNQIKATLPVGSGPEQTLTIGDMMGCLSGYNITSQLANVSRSIANLPTTNLTRVYNVMGNVMRGQYGNIGPSGSNIIIPSGQPGAGSYGSPEAAIDVLVPMANSNIATIAAGNPAAVTSINSNWLTIANVVFDNRNNFVKADIDYENITGNQQPALFSFVESLHEAGVDVGPDGDNTFITSIANPATFGGQAVLACLQEGRNLLTLSSSGIGNDTQIPSTL